MKLCLVRHAIAERSAFRKGKKRRPDSERPLTAKGRRRFAAELKGLRAQTGRADILVTSPYLRARDTARMLRKAFPKARLVVEKSLTPEKTPRAFLAWLRKQKRGASIVCVGHEPHLGRLAAYLCWEKSRRACA